MKKIVNAIIGYVKSLMKYRSIRLAVMPIVVVFLVVWAAVMLPITAVAIVGFKIQQYLMRVMPKKPFTEGIMLQAPQSRWHKFLGYLVHKFVGGGAYAVPPMTHGNEQWYICTLTRVNSRILLWHELGHCVDRNAQPTSVFNALLDHTGKGARYEKKADLYAYRKAFRELPREEAVKEVQQFCKLLRKAGRFQFGLTDSVWRARLAERYIRRYYQQ
jgi:hypothetical protein